MFAGILISGGYGSVEIQDWFGDGKHCNIQDLPDERYSHTQVNMRVIYWTKDIWDLLCPESEYSLWRWPTEWNSTVLLGIGIRRVETQSQFTLSKVKHNIFQGIKKHQYICFVTFQVQKRNILKNDKNRGQIQQVNIIGKYYKERK